MLATTASARGNEWLCQPRIHDKGRGELLLSTEEFRLPCPDGRHLAVSVPRYGQHRASIAAGHVLAHGAPVASPLLATTPPRPPRWPPGLARLGLTKGEEDGTECCGLLPTPSALASSSASLAADGVEATSDCSTADTEDESYEPGLVTAATAWAEALLPPLGSKERPTRGSTAHYLGTCRPCTYLLRGDCKDGVFCLYCHLCGDTCAKKQRKQNWDALKRAALQSQERASTVAPTWFFHPTFAL